MENLESYNNLINHVEDLHKLQDCSTLNEGVSNYNQMPF